MKVIPYKTGMVYECLWKYECLNVYYWHKTTWLISPERIQYIRKIRAEVRFRGMFISFGGGIGFFGDIDHQPIPGTMSIFYISSMVDQPSSTTQKNDNHKKSKTTKDVPFKKGYQKRSPPPSTPVLLHFQGRLAIHRDVLKQCFLPFKGHLQFRLHVLFFWPAKTCRASLIELDDGKIYRKPLYLMVKTMVSCRFSLKPIHWKSWSKTIKTYELVMGIKLLDSTNHNLLLAQLDRSTDFGQLLCFTYTWGCSLLQRTAGFIASGYSTYIYILYMKYFW